MAPHLTRRKAHRLPTAWLATACCAGALAGGCTVGPDYEPPKTTDEILTDRFDTGDPTYKVGETDMSRWWEVFGDPQLTSLIQRAAEDNKDLQVAVAKVTEARARLGFAKAGRYPSVSLGGGSQRQQDGTTGFATRTVSNIGAEASWEIDVFGRVARQVESADAEFAATEEDRRDVQVALFAEVARAYLGVRALQTQLTIAQRNIESQQEILGLTERRVGAGIASDLDVALARSVLAASEAQVPTLRINLAREINTLGVLVGRNPQALHSELQEPKPIPVPPTSVTIGVPADVLRQRPDIRAAERRLAAQTARVGVATAELYPQFSLNASIGYSNPQGGNLLSAANRGFALGPSIRWQLFDGGRLRANIRVEDARVTQAMLLYESAILSALEEVETSLTTFTENRVRVEALERAATQSREALRLSTILYRDGLADYETVLDVQRSLLSQESEVANARGQAATSLVLLYRAMGGGWDPSEAIEEESAEG